MAEYTDGRLWIAEGNGIVQPLAKLSANDRTHAVTIALNRGIIEA